MTAVPDLATLRAVALDEGLAVLGATSAAPFEQTRVVLEQRKADGLNGSMAFTYKNPARSTDPERTLPGARTLLVGARSYHRDLPPAPEGRGPVARVARYVWADDHDRLHAGLEAVAGRLRATGARAVVIADQNHLVDRAVAQRAGLGWFGKNANLLLPGRGSWYLLGAVLTDAVVPGADDAVEEVADGCGTCDRCLPACPTGAIVGPGVVDARRCLSWSLQVTGPFPREQRIALGDRLYGCDDCQEVCPHNRREVRRAAPGGRGEAIPLGDPGKAWVPVLELLAAADEELMDRHGRWYIPRREARYLRRNALVVLGNTGDGEDAATRAALARYLAHEDPLLRAQAVWSSYRLGCNDLLSPLRNDPDPEVRAELAEPPPTRRMA